MASPKVLVGCPTADAKSYCLKQYVDRVKALTYTNKEIWLVDNSKTKDYFEQIKKEGLNVIKDEFSEMLKERIVHSRNILRQKVIEEGYDYFLSLEQDVIPPVDIIERLLAHGKEIICGVYYGLYFDQENKPIVRPLVWAPVQEDNSKMRFMSSECKEWGAGKQKLYEIRACGLGCVLIHRSVLEKIKFRIREDRAAFDDIVFCDDAASNGFKIYADLSLHCEHMIGDQVKDDKSKW